MKDLKRVLNIEQMYMADSKTIASGIAGIELMHNAGQQVFEVIKDNFTKTRVLVLCGPGNNGGDGFVVAKLLEDAGWGVTLMAMLNKDSYKGDAKIAATEFKGKILSLGKNIKLGDFGLVVDALFGVGLSKPLREDVKDLLQNIKKLKIPVVAVDIPSGVNGNTGEVDTASIKADITVTFACKKQGHLLYPAQEFIGGLHVVDIGIKPEIYKDFTPKIYENSKAVWRDEFPVLKTTGHKYDKGHAVIYGGNKMTGAARLAAGAASRIGAGLVTIMADKDSFPIYANYQASLIVEDKNDKDSLLEYLADARKNAFLIGSGAGVNQDLKEKVLAVLKESKIKNRSFVIDADAISIFAQEPEKLFSVLDNRCVLTPHTGEFKRLFANVKADNKVDRALIAAEISGAVVVLKGADTVIASPDGMAVINTNAPPYLATAGTGDVLAGMITGLLAQKMPVFEAACAGVWLHSECANIFGAGLIADDIEKQIPKIFKAL